MKASIAKAVLARAGGCCEVCGATHFGLELDHAESRRVPDSAETIWALCRDCHYQRTNSIPSAAYWLKAWIRHLRKHGYDTTKAASRLFFVEARTELGKGLR